MGSSSWRAKEVCSVSVVSFVSQKEGESSFVVGGKAIGRRIGVGPVPRGMAVGAEILGEFQARKCSDGERGCQSERLPELAMEVGVSLPATIPRPNRDPEGGPPTCTGSSERPHPGSAELAHARLESDLVAVA